MDLREVLSEKKNEKQKRYVLFTKKNVYEKNGVEYLGAETKIKGKSYFKYLRKLTKHLQTELHLRHQKWF